MTEKLYYTDAYLTEFDARILEADSVDGRIRVRLDRTAFYPEGGGQGADHGFLTSAQGTQARVVDVQEADGGIWHYVSGETDSGLFRAGDTVHGRIDWERRFDHMQQHSGEHIVSGMICSTFHCDNVGFHLGEDAVTIDFNTRISMEQAEMIERRANAYLWEDHPLKVLWPSAQELGAISYRSKKELSGEVRLTAFPGADICACCGTHVSGSAQIGVVKFLSARNFHEGTRLELLCGNRAYRFLAMNYQANKQAAVLLSTSESNTADRVAGLLEENQRLKAAVSSMESRLFSMWAESFRGESSALVVEEHLSAEQGRALADQIAGVCTGLTAVFTRTKERYSYTLIRKGADISRLVRDMNQALDGRGGGRNGFAQGSVTAGKADIEMYFRNL